MASGIHVGGERDVFLGVEGGEPLYQGRTDRGVRAAADELLGMRRLGDGNNFGGHSSALQIKVTC